MTKDVHHLVEVLTKFLRIEMRHNLIKDARGSLLHRANDME
jgi:hypothetical protein